ncbi:MAG: cytochrome C biogenesis protein [Calditrichaeota bacterium]|nr:MAG: cytochrome C biogenesis protein [Calditrichota bacterium]
MKEIIHLLNVLLPLLYLTSIFFYSQSFFRSDRFAQKYKSSILSVTCVLHLSFVVLKGLFFRRFPIGNVFEFASVLALSLVLIYLFIEFKLKLKTTGLFILSIVFPLQLISSLFFNPEYQLPTVLHSPMLIFHTSTVILGYSAFFLSALYALMYLLLFHELKKAQFGVIYQKMPSLEALIDLSYRTAVIGFFFLTITIFLGIMWRKNAFPDTAHMDPKVIATYSVWVLYGILIIGKKFARWTNKWLAYLSIVGLVVIILSMIIVNLLVKSFHQFG